MRGYFAQVRRAGFDIGNPSDNQAVRFLLEDLRAGKACEETRKEQ